MAWVSKSGYIRACKLKPSHLFCIALVSSTENPGVLNYFLQHTDRQKQVHWSTSEEEKFMSWWDGGPVACQVGNCRQFRPQCISTILNVSQPSSMYLNHPQCISTKLNVAQCSPTSLNGSLCWSTCQQDPRAGTSASLLDMRWNRDDRPFDSRQLLRLRLRTLVLANNKWISAR